MKNTEIKFCNEVVHPGESLSFALPLPQLFSCAPLYMPIKVSHGKEEGPCLIIVAAMYGNEINGTEIIHRLLNLPQMTKLKGTLIAVPVLNVYGLLNRSRNLHGNVDLNRCFPGAPHGSNAERLAHIFSSEIFTKANYCINLLTGPLNYSNLPLIYADLADPIARDLAETFNAPVILNAPMEIGSLQTLAQEQKIPFLSYEAGEAMLFDEDAIKIGLQGILNIMRKIHMLPERKVRKEKILKSLFAENIIWVTAPSSGTTHSKHTLGHHVKKDEALCVIKDPFGTTDNLTLTSPYEGIIVGKNNLPLTHEGDGLFQLAVFPQMRQAADHLEKWNEEITSNG